MIIACIVVAVLNRHRFAKLLDTLNKGTVGSFLPIMNVASEVAYGAVIASLAAFVTVREALKGLFADPVISLFVVVNVLAGMTGSASGGLSLALGALGEYYAHAAAGGADQPADHAPCRDACVGRHGYPAAQWRGDHAAVDLRAHAPRVVLRSVRRRFDRHDAGRHPRDHPERDLRHVLREAAMSRLALLMCAIFVVAPARAAELRLITAELPPYTFQMPPATVAEFPGPGQGLVQEVVAEMARRVGHSGTIEYMPWARAQQIAMTEPNIGILSLTRSPEREDKYRWLVKIVTDDLVWSAGRAWTSRASTRRRTAPPACCCARAPKRCCAKRASRASSPRPRSGSTRRRLKERRIDAWLAPRLMVIYAMQEVQGDLGTLNMGEIVRASDIYLAASKSLPDSEAAKWEQAFESMKADGSYDRIVQKYRRLKAAPIADEARKVPSSPDWTN